LAVILAVRSAKEKRRTSEEGLEYRHWRSLEVEGGHGMVVMTQVRLGRRMTATFGLARSQRQKACRHLHHAHQRLGHHRGSGGEFETGAQAKSVLRRGISDRRELGSFRLALTLAFSAGRQRVAAS
jgi:hypothetical protein